MTVAESPSTLRAWDVRSSYQPNLRVSTPGNFPQDEQGQEELEPPPRGHVQNQPLVARKVQGGDDHIGVQDHSHVWG